MMSRRIAWVPTTTAARTIMMVLVVSARYLLPWVTTQRTSQNHSSSATAYARNATTKALSPKNDSMPHHLLSSSSTRNSSTGVLSWQNYRLGDAVLRKGNVGPRYDRQFPGSIAAEYVAKNLGYVKEDFCDIVRRRKETALKAGLLDLPGPGDFVVHLRLGDVLDQKIRLDEIEDVWDHGVSLVPLQIRNMIDGHNTLGWWHYVKSKCYYSAILGLLPNTIDRVVLIGSALHRARRGHTAEISMAYISLVKQFFEAAGYPVSVRNDGLPDDDMVWMAHASVFASSGGGFSRLANDCVGLFGGTTFALSTGWSTGLNEACGKEPRPEIKMRNYSWEKSNWHGRGGSWDGNKTFPTDFCVNGWELTCVRVTPG